MPLKCKTCGQCHTRKGGCAPSALDVVKRLAGPKPEPKSELGEWQLRCSKHCVHPNDCCQGDYTARWRWITPSVAPPDPLADLQRRAQRCVTHSYGCACQELRRVELEARVAELESERESLLSLVRSSLKPHGLCQPRERKACTACNATDELREKVKQWGGLRVHLMDER